MSMPRFRPYPLSFCAFLVALAGCQGRSSTLLDSPSAALQTRVRPAYGVIYSFKGCPDGWEPVGSLAYVNGTLYGTTALGGAYNCSGFGNYGYGTVFAATVSGGETVSHSFAGSPNDGASPEGSLINTNGAYYGTTFQGGSSDQGAVFAITASGGENLVHSFDGNNGSEPTANLLHSQGAFYGTTPTGGSHNDGTVFKITPSGKEAVIYNFKGKEDGWYPNAGLLNVNGTLYGTTAFGGGGPCLPRRFSCGTVFSVTKSGDEKVLYRFKGAKDMDGAKPWANLIDVGGLLYGTTQIGGSYLPTDGGEGTVFTVTTSGKESVLYSFGSVGGTTDGLQPYAPLLNVNGTLYGTTSGGGEYHSGTVYEITTSGEETVLHSFDGSDGSGDGATPYAGLINVNGTLYGTTASGSQPTAVYGTVFSLSP